MIDIEHPDIGRIRMNGYPSQEYLDFEREEEREEDDGEE